MKSSNGSLVKTNITYGLLVLVPVAVLVLLVAKLIEIMDAAAKSLGLDSMISAGLAGVAALVVSLAACFAIRAAVCVESWAAGTTSRPAGSSGGSAASVAEGKRSALDNLRGIRELQVAGAWRHLRRLQTL